MSDWIGVHTYASQEIVCQYQPWGPNTEKDSQDFVNQAIKDSVQTQEQGLFLPLYKMKF